MENNELQKLISRLDERNQLLLDKERDLADRGEELAAQKEELTAAIEEVIHKNAFLTETLHKLQQRNQELDQILYRASHDLKSPVTSIFGLLDLLKGEGLTESQRIISEHLFQKTSQMMVLLTSLNRLAQAAFDSIQTNAVKIHSLILKTISELKNHSNFEKAVFQTHVSDALEFSGDDLKLGIVLKCLLENALSFQETALVKIVISAEVNDQKLLIAIEDNGEGIDNNVKDKIFEMFYRGSERSHGAGLGLYIVKSILDRLGGSVSFESTRGKTIFKVALPLSG